MSRKRPQIDAARLTLMLTELRLPTMKAVWPRFTEQADQEGWPAAHALATLAEQELADRVRRRIERHLTAAQLPPGKTLENFDFNAVPMISKAQVIALMRVITIIDGLLITVSEGRPPSGLMV